MKSVSIRDMIKALEQLVISKELTEWQDRFVMSVSKYKDDTSKLSDKQVDIIDDLYHKHF